MAAAGLVLMEHTIDIPGLLDLLFSVASGPHSHMMLLPHCRFNLSLQCGKAFLHFILHL